MKYLDFKAAGSLLYWRTSCSMQPFWSRCCSSLWPEVVTGASEPPVCSSLTLCQHSASVMHWTQCQGQCFEGNLALFFEGFGSLCDEKLERHCFYICRFLHLHVFFKQQNICISSINQAFSSVYWKLFTSPPCTKAESSMHLLWADRLGRVSGRH